MSLDDRAERKKVRETYMMTKKHFDRIKRTFANCRYDNRACPVSPEEMQCYRRELIERQRPEWLVTHYIWLKDRFLAGPRGILP